MKQISAVEESKDINHFATCHWTFFFLEPITEMQLALATSGQVKIANLTFEQIT